MLKRLTGDIVIYGIGHVSQQALALLTLPIFARLLSPDEYGLLETITTVGAVIGMIAFLCFDSSLQRTYFDYGPDEPERRRGVIVTAMLTVAVWNVVLLLVLWPLYEPLMRYLQGPLGSGRILAIALMTQALTYPILLCREVLRLLHRPWAYTALAICQSMLWLAASLGCIYWLNGGLTGYIVGGLLSVFLTLPVALWLIRGELRGRYSLPDLREMLRFALPLIPTAGAMWLMNMVDRLILNHWVDIAQIGYYGMGQKMTRLVGIVAMAFSVAWTPFILEIFARDRNQERVVRAQVAPLFYAGLAWSAVVLTGFAPEIIRLMASAAYLPAVPLVGPLCLAAVGAGLIPLLATPISLAKQTRFFALYTALCGGTNVALNLLLVPRWGTVGSAWATAASFGLLNLAYYLTGQKLHPAPYPAKGLLATTGLVVAAVAVLPALPGLAWRTLLVIGVLPLIYAFGGLDRELIRKALAQGWQVVRQLRRRKEGL